MGTYKYGPVHIPQSSVFQIDLPCVRSSGNCNYSVRYVRLDYCMRFRDADPIGNRFTNSICNRSLSQPPVLRLSPSLVVQTALVCGHTGGPRMLKNMPRRGDAAFQRGVTGYVVAQSLQSYEFCLDRTS